MTRAEEAALKAYPQKGDNVFIQEGYRLMRSIYVDGYEAGYVQAQKDTIERAIEWLETNAEKYIVDVTPTYPDAPQELIIGGKCWDELRKAMEEQK